MKSVPVEKFDKEFPASEYVFHHRGVGCFGDAIVRGNIQRHISKAIQAARIEAKEEERNSIAEKVKALSKEELFVGETQYRHDKGNIAFVYNMALDDTLSIINKHQ